MTNAADPDLLQYLEAVLSKARAGEVLFFVASAALITGPSVADVLAASFMPTAAAVLSPESRREAYVQTLQGLAGATQALSGPIDVPESGGVLS